MPDNSWIWISDAFLLKIGNIIFLGIIFRSIGRSIHRRLESKGLIGEYVADEGTYGIPDGQGWKDITSYTIKKWRFLGDDKKLRRIWVISIVCKNLGCLTYYIAALLIGIYCLGGC